jgi:hypothetical protein
VGRYFVQSRWADERILPIRAPPMIGLEGLRRGGRIDRWTQSRSRRRPARSEVRPTSRVKGPYPRCWSFDIVACHDGESRRQQSHYIDVVRAGKSNRRTAGGSATIRSKGSRYCRRRRIGFIGCQCSGMFRSSWCLRLETAIPNPVHSGRGTCSCRSRSRFANQV